jgi:diguanylate cyclase (GGDEF)-like protein
MCGPVRLPSQDARRPECHHLLLGRPGGSHDGCLRADDGTCPFFRGAEKGNPAMTVRRDVPPPSALSERLRRAPAVPPSAFDALTRDVGRCMGAQSVLLFACEDTAVTHVVSAWGSAADDEATGRHALQRAFAGGVLRRGRGAAGRLEPRADGAAVNGNGHISHAVAAPVATRTGYAGALLAGFRGGLPADREQQLWIIERYCALAGLCLHDADVLDGLLASTARDALTGCLNYAGTLRVLDAERKRSARYGFEMSCAFIALDGVQDADDERGLVHANKVLAAAATAMRAGVRASDTIGRYGGHEFIAIFPQTSEADALRLGRRLQTRIRTATLALRKKPVDASIGVAQWTDGASVEALLREADRALLIAKHEPCAVVAASDSARGGRRDGGGS